MALLVTSSRVDLRCTRVLPDLVAGCKEGLQLRKGIACAGKSAHTGMEPTTDGLACGAIIAEEPSGIKFIER